MIANKEENLKTEVLAVSEFCPVYTSDIIELNDALKMITDIGELTGRQQKAAEIAMEINNRFSVMPAFSSFHKAAYMIWKNPLMVAGEDTFINSILNKVGLHNVFSNKSRYPIVSVADLQEQSPEVILLSSEPFPFRQKHIEEFQSYLPQARIILVDGEMFSWYGSRLLHTPSYLSQLADILR